MFKKMNLTPRTISVLLRLARSPEKEYYIREMAGAVGISVGGTYNALEMLHGSGLVKKRKAGRNTYYKINLDHPAIRRIKIFMNIMDLNELVESLKDRCRKIVLFGSCSTGEDTMESDIDILAVTEQVDEVKKVLKRVHLERRIKPVVLAPHEFIVLKDNDPAFYREINNGIVLWREKNE